MIGRLNIFLNSSRISHECLFGFFRYLILEFPIPKGGSGMRNILILSVVMFGFSTVDARDIFVSPNGSDSPDGSAGKPFSTLQQAADYAKTHHEVSDIVIRNGVYRLTEPVVFDGAFAPGFTVRADNPGKAHFTGGREFTISEMKPVSDSEVLSRLPAVSREKVLELDLSALLPEGFKSAWPKQFRGFSNWPEIFVNDYPLSLARWPDSGHVRAEKILNPGKGKDAAGNPQFGIFTYRVGEAPANWMRAPEVYVGGYWKFKWFDEFIKVDSINPETREIKLAAQTHYELAPPERALYFVINILEELNLPGEYVYDRERGKIYLYPPTQSPDAKLTVTLMDKPLISVRDAWGVTIDGLTLSHSASRGITVDNSREVLISNCMIKNISGNAVDIKGGSRCGVTNSRIRNIGSFGVRLHGGDRKTLTPSAHYVENCEISHFSRFVNTYTPAVEPDGVGQIVRNNYFHDAPHCAILFRGNDHIISGNLIERVCQNTADAGAIYCGRDWTMGGNLISDNLITGLGSASHLGNWGIYLDDMASGITVRDNVMMSVTGGMLVGGGRDNVIAGNLFLNCPGVSLMYDQRGFAKWFNSHIVDSSGTMRVLLRKVDIHSGVWLKRFPYLTDISEENMPYPKANIIIDNICAVSKKLNIAKLVLQDGRVENNIDIQKTDFKWTGNTLFFPVDVNPQLQRFSGKKYGPIEKK